MDHSGEFDRDHETLVVPFHNSLRGAPLTLRRWDGGPSVHRTTVELSRDDSHLRFGFECIFGELNVDPSLPAQQAPGLWQLDVVEVFVSDQPAGIPYHEVEASPLGQWLSLTFDAPRVPSKRLRPVTPRVEATIAHDRFTVVMILAIDALRSERDRPPRSERDRPLRDWRLGLFRIAGRQPLRTYDAYRPTGTAVPDFHTPTSWARLHLPDAAPIAQQSW